MHTHSASTSGLTVGPYHRVFTDFPFDEAGYGPTWFQGVFSGEAFVRGLQDEGYGIDSAPHRGYRLTAPPEALLPRELARGLATRWLGHRLVFA